MKKVSLEERVYRHRCVEGWAMTVPWTGFPHEGAGRDVRADGRGEVSSSSRPWPTPRPCPAFVSSQFEWPYVEGMTMAEANNDLAFLATGLYGKSIPKQNGAPIRLVLPWKYGFKSVKSIVRVSFTDKRPKTFWEGLQPSEYGFWANVNPDVPAPPLVSGDGAVCSAVTSGCRRRSITAMASSWRLSMPGSLPKSCSCDCRSASFTVLAAVFLVGAVALVVADGGRGARSRTCVDADVGRHGRSRMRAIQPAFGSGTWLLAAAVRAPGLDAAGLRIGLICAGVAAGSFNLGRTSPSRRKRS